MFVDSAFTFSKVDFSYYNELISLSSKEIPLEWKPLPRDNNISHLFLNFDITHVFAHCHDKESGVHLFVTHQEFNRVQDTI